MGGGEGRVRWGIPERRLAPPHPPRPRGSSPRAYGSRAAGPALSALWAERAFPWPPLFFGGLACGRHHRLADFRVLFQIGLGVLAALPNALAVIGKPRARFLDHPGLHAEIDQLAALGDAFAVHDVEIDDLERRRHLVLDDLDPGLIADHLVALLDRTDAADVEAQRGVEFERIAAGRGLGIAEHDADLEADLIDENDDRPRARNRAGQFAQRLAHQAGVQSDMAVAHLAFKFGA